MKAAVKDEKTFKTMIFLDASNYYIPAKKRGFRIDELRLRDFLSKGRFVIQTHYFSAVDGDNPGQIRFLNKLKESGLIVHTAPLVFRVKEIKCNLCGSVQNVKCEKCGVNITLPPHQSKEIDIQLALTLVLTSGSYDEAIIVSGDKDFLPVVKYLREKLSKRIIIVSYDEQCSYAYKQDADAIIYFEKIESEVAYPYGQKK